MQLKFLFYFRFAHVEANVTVVSLSVAIGKCTGVANKLAAVERFQAVAMVVMAMTKHNMRYCSEVDPHYSGIVHKKIALPGVKQNNLSVVLNKIR